MTDCIPEADPSWENFSSMHLEVKWSKMTCFQFHNWIPHDHLWFCFHGHLEADVVLLAPGLLVGVVSSEDEAVAGEGGLLGGGHDGVVHVRLTWVTHPQISSGQGVTDKQRNHLWLKLTCVSSFVWDLDKLFISRLPVFTFVYLWRDAGHDGDNARDKDSHLCPLFCHSHSLYSQSEGLRRSIRGFMMSRQPMRGLHDV